MIKICNMCGADIRPGADKCSCCGCYVVDVAVDRNQLFVNYNPPQKNSNTNSYYSAPPAPAAPAAPAAPMSFAASGKDAEYNLFAGANWQNAWMSKRASAYKLGIVLTDTGDVENVGPFMQALNSYIEYKASQGIEYYVLDLYDQNVRTLSALNIENRF